MKLPEPHSRFVRAAVEELKKDLRIVGVAIGGSALTGEADEFSDVDLVIAIEPTAFEEVMADRRSIAERLGPLLSAFAGDHVGEPRLLICLYDSPLLHVDLKFLVPDALAARVEDPEILWERGNAMTAGVDSGDARYPAPDLQWIEDRFWTWIHYGAARAARGELFETMDMLAFLRRRVFGPLILQATGAPQPGGVRRIESRAPQYLESLRGTVASHNAAECLQALSAAVALYRDLRDRLADDTLVRMLAVEGASVEYLEAVRETLLNSR